MAKRSLPGQTELMDYMHTVTAPRVEQLEAENAALRNAVFDTKRHADTLEVVLYNCVQHMSGSQRMTQREIDAWVVQARKLLGRPE